MKPSQVANTLKFIAQRIENSKYPSKNLVACEILSVIQKIDENTSYPAFIFNMSVWSYSKPMKAYNEFMNKVHQKVLDQNYKGTIVDRKNGSFMVTVMPMGSIYVEKPTEQELDRLSLEVKNMYDRAFVETNTEYQNEWKWKIKLMATFYGTPEGLKLS
jgi:hypothetical protein